MKILLSISASLALAIAGTVAGRATARQRDGSWARTSPVAALATKRLHIKSTGSATNTASLVSMNLAAFGSSVTSPRGPYRARPRKIAFDLGGYYGAGTKGLWIDHLRCVDWGEPVAYASGVVHARVWPSHKFMTTSGGIMIDELRSCGTPTYYTSAAMAVPAGYPVNTESSSVATSEQALTPC
jgi:hypothetical protein